MSEGACVWGGGGGGGGREAVARGRLQGKKGVRFCCCVITVPGAGLVVPVQANSCMHGGTGYREVFKVALLAGSSPGR